MINFLIFNIVSMIFINFLKINSIKKIVFFIILNYFIIFNLSRNIFELIEYSIFLISILYIFINFYTVRYSSIRIKILNDLYHGKKILSEKNLFNDRKNRLELNDTSFMKKELFQFIFYLVKFLKKTLN